MTNPIERLSRRQSAVLDLMVRGFLNKEIALHLGLSERLVKACTSELFLLFDVSNRTELAGLVAAQRLAPSGRPSAAVSQAGVSGNPGD